MENKCGAKKRDGNPCGAPPIKGGKRCVRHGGKAPQVQAAARRMAEAAAQDQMVKAVRTLGLPIDIDPGKALLDEIHMTAGHVAWLRERVRDLTESQLVWGESQREHGYNDKGSIDISTEKADPSIWYQLYLKEREHLAKVCSLALRAGIEERKVKLAESQGLLVADVIRRILGALGLTPEQQQMVPEIVPRELRALAAGNN